MHAQARIDHAARVIGRHGAGAGRVVNRTGALAEVGKNLRFALHLRAGQVFAADDLGQRRGSGNAAQQARAVHDVLPVVFGGEKVGFYARLGQRVGRGNQDAAPAGRAAGVKRDQERRKRVRVLQLEALAHWRAAGRVADGVEVQMQIGPGQLGAAAHKGAGLVHAHAQRAFAVP